MTELTDLALELSSVVVFRRVREDAVLRALSRYLTCRGGDVRRMEKYSQFVSALFDRGGNLSRYILDAISEDENPYVLCRARGEAVPEHILRCVKNELTVFQKLSDLTPEALWCPEGNDGCSPDDPKITRNFPFLPRFDREDMDIPDMFEKRMSRVATTGFGPYARHVMFRVQNGEILPVRNPDRTGVSRLFGYDLQRQQLIDNTNALLSGLPAANTLLIGDAGTGKSSSVKAVANLLAPRGLRLIEVPKAELRHIPAITEHLRDNPLKFILFIDDLSFEKSDDTFSAMKAILEGSVSVKSPNTVIYATSNRRHLVKESMSDRDGDDIHLNDTIQDTVALSDRFGLTILFTRPTRELYLRIVHELCAAKSIPETPDLDTRACAFAIRRGGMTPRAAEQFTDSILTNNPLQGGNTSVDS